MSDEQGHRPADAGRLRLGLALVAAFLAAEVVVGLLAHSVALLADAGHLLTDVAGLGAALVAARLSRRPAQGSLTFGLRRLDVLAAQANGALLLVVGVVIGIEAIDRLVHPAHVEGLALVVVAAVGLVVNTVVTFVLAGGDRASMNVSAALAHIRADALSEAVTVLAGVVILASGWRRADPVASLAVVAVLLATGVRLLAKTGRVLLEAAPVGVDPDAVLRSMTGDHRVASVHELHLWLITSGFPALSAHVLVRPGEDCHVVRADLESALDRTYGIAHTTLQVEHAADDLLTISARQPDEGAPGA
ncbi:MAG TPA: cation diffusion facilitator family transporter [Mycobacteriales bacterium]